MWPPHRSQRSKSHTLSLFITDKIPDKEVCNVADWVWGHPYVEMQGLEHTSRILHCKVHQDIYMILNLDASYTFGKLDVNNSWEY